MVGSDGAGTPHHSGVHELSPAVLPAAALLPALRLPGWNLAPVRGDGRVYSWVVANRSFAPEFDKDVPYGIVAVDLSDGGRLIGRYLGDHSDLLAGLAVVAEVERKDGFGLLWFAPAEAQDRRRRS